MNFRIRTMGNVTKKVKENGGGANVQLAFVEPNNAPPVIPKFESSDLKVVEPLSEEQKKMITDSW